MGILVVFTSGLTACSGVDLRGGGGHEANISLTVVVADSADQQSVRFSPGILSAVAAGKLRFAGLLCTSFPVFWGGLPMELKTSCREFGSALHVMLFLENPIWTSCIFNRLRSRRCQRALHGVHYQRHRVIGCRAYTAFAPLHRTGPTPREVPARLLVRLSRGCRRSV
jgi:hypothetical protein